MLSGDEVCAAYVKLLSRQPESEEIIALCIARYADVSSLQAGIRNSPEYRERCKAALTDLYALTDGYQAVYGLPNMSLAHARETVDRCAAIERYVLDGLRAGTVAHLSVLDVGCAQGYASMYFSERGSHVIGIDVNNDNIAFCRSLSRVTGLDALFLPGRFGNEAAELSADYGVNAVLLLSVLHHVIHSEGLQETRQGIGRLLAQGAVLFCELALATEPPSLPWQASLPEDPRAIFPKDAHVQHLGNFKALSGLATRPLYAVHSTALRYRSFGSIGSSPVMREAALPDMWFSDVTSGPVRIKTYRGSSELFAKTIRLTRSSGVDVQRVLTAEAMVAQRLGVDGVSPPLLGVSLGEASVTLVFQYVEGVKLSFWAERVGMAERRSLAVQIAHLVVYIASLGLSWNDCREHNVIVDAGGRPFLIDFEAVTLLPLEDDFVRAAFILWHLCHTEAFRAEMEQFAHVATANLPRVPGTSDVPEWGRVALMLADRQA